MLDNSLSKPLYYPDWTIVFSYWSSRLHRQTSTTDPECCSQSGQSSHHKMALVASCCSHQIQVSDFHQQNNHCLLPKLITSDLCASRNLHSKSECRLVVPSQRGTKSLSLTFFWSVPCWWNDLPNSNIAAESVAIFKKRLMTHLSFCMYYLYTIKSTSTALD